MHARTLILWFALLCLLASGCQDKASTVSVSKADLTAVSLEYRWATPVATPPGHRVRDIWLMDENLYILTDQNLLMAFDAVRGLPRWSRDIALGDNEVFQPIHVDDISLPKKILSVIEMQDLRSDVELVTFDAAIVHSIDRVLVLDRRNGKIYRDLEFSDLGISSVITERGAVSGNTFYYPATDGTYTAMGLDAVVRKWRSSTRGLVLVSFKSHNRTLYIGDGTGMFQAINTMRMEDRLIWQRDLETDIVGDFVVDDMGCFVPTQANRLYGLTPTGGLIDGYPVVFDGELVNPVQTSSASLFVYATGDGLHCVNRVTGEKRWKIPEGRFVVASRQGDVFLIDKDNNLRIVDEVQGRNKATVPMTGFVKYAHAPAQELIYAVTADDRIYCIQKIPDVD
jgi:outer membrane protein assembly factor BamB